MVGFIKTRKHDLFTIVLLLGVLLFLIANIRYFQHTKATLNDVILSLNSIQNQVSFGEEVGLLPGSGAPDFGVLAVSGEEVTLDFYREKRLLLVFSSTDCASCDRVYPILEKIQRAYPDVEVLVITSGPKKDLQPIHESGLFRVAEWEEGVAIAYKIAGTPFYTIINEKGIVLDSGFLTTVQALGISLG